MMRDREFILTEDIIKSNIDLIKKLKNLTFADPEKSRSLTEILDAEYLANSAR